MRGIETDAYDLMEKVSILADENLRKKVQAIIKHLEIPDEEVDEFLEDIDAWRYEHYGLTVLLTPEGDFAVGTEDEVHEACKECICDQLWTFRPEIILRNCDLPLELEEMFSTFQKVHADTANDVLLELIEKYGDLDELVETVTSEDGYGHFLAEDGKEYYVTVDGELYYIFPV